MIRHGRGCGEDCDDCYHRRHPTVDPATLCHCCGAADDPDGPGPAINTGYCEDCGAAECGERLVGTPCRVVRQ